MKFKEAHLKFLEYCEITKNRANKTLENYGHYLGRFREFAGDNQEVETIDLDLVNSYRLHLNRMTDEENKQLLTTKTQSYHIIALRAFLKFLIKQGIETLAPEKIELPKNPDRSVDFLEREELERLFAAISRESLSGKRDYAIYGHFFRLGCEFRNWFR